MSYHLKYEDKENELNNCLLKKIKKNKLKSLIPFIYNKLNGE